MHNHCAVPCEFSVTHILGHSHLGAVCALCSRSSRAAAVSLVCAYNQYADQCWSFKACIWLPHTFCLRALIHRNEAVCALCSSLSRAAVVLVWSVPTTNMLTNVQVLRLAYDGTHIPFKNTHPCVCSALCSRLSRAAVTSLVCAYNYNQCADQCWSFKACIFRFRNGAVCTVQPFIKSCSH